MNKFLLVATSALLLGASNVFGQSFDRLAFDLQLGPSGSLPPATTYNQGVGPGQPYHNQTIASVSPTDVIRMSDLHAFTTQASGNDVVQVDFNLSISNFTGGGTPVEASGSDVLPIVCGDPIIPWRFVTPTCAPLIDREWSLDSPIEIPVSSVASSGVIQISLTATLTSISSPFFAIVAYQTYLSVSAPLPVELSSFTASPSPYGNRVEWTAASEVDLYGYTLERSTDASTFDDLAQVAAVGSAETETVYTQVDQAPAATTYYRLKAEDLDGTVTYSDIISVTRDDVRPEIQLSPNPAKDFVTVVGSQDKPTIRVYDFSGKLLLEQFGASSQSTLDLSRLAAGYYSVQITSEGVSQTKRLVIQR